jgi:hypothetical protein
MATLAGCSQAPPDEDGEAQIIWDEDQQVCSEHPGGGQLCTQGESDASLVDWVQCGPGAVLRTRPFGSYGAARVWVEDANGTILYDGFADSAGGAIERQGGDYAELQGQPGRWSLHVEPRNYSGRLTATLTCA